jgi:hypothetical protein
MVGAGHEPQHSMQFDADGLRLRRSLVDDFVTPRGWPEEEAMPNDKARRARRDDEVARGAIR